MGYCRRRGRRSVGDWRAMQPWNTDLAVVARAAPRLALSVCIFDAASAKFSTGLGLRARVRVWPWGAACAVDGHLGAAPPNPLPERPSSVTKLRGSASSPGPRLTRIRLSGRGPRSLRVGVAQRFGVRGPFVTLDTKNRILAYGDSARAHGGAARRGADRQVAHLASGGEDDEERGNNNLDVVGFHECNPSVKGLCGGTRRVHTAGPLLSIARFDRRSIIYERTRNTPRF